MGLRVDANEFSKFICEIFSLDLFSIIAGLLERESRTNCVDDFVDVGSETLGILIVKSAKSSYPMLIYLFTLFECEHLNAMRRPEECMADEDVVEILKRLFFGEVILKRMLEDMGG